MITLVGRSPWSDVDWPCALVKPRLGRQQEAADKLNAGGESWVEAVAHKDRTIPHVQVRRAGV